jgi:2-methylaconitate cis-trans-isomerase PrpF
MQRRFPAVVMRGGTSKGVFFHENHLPRDQSLRDRLISRLFGSPDPNQIDGLGGAASVTSKTAIIAPASSLDHDVVYTFGQVSIDRPLVDYKANCGNISAAVGPFAVDEGLVPAIEPVTTVRIHQKNTDKLIIAEVPVKNGRFACEGSYAISGVPGTGARIVLHFHDPGGAVTGRLLPTGNPRDILAVPGLGEVEVSLVDAGNPVVFVRAERLGLDLRETRSLQAPSVRARIEAVRARAAVLLGLAASDEEASRSVQTVPKIAVVAPPVDYPTLSGDVLSRDRIDVTARIMTMGELHKAYSVSGAICTAGAACIEGTVVHEAVAGETLGPLRIGHPSGVFEIDATMVRKDGQDHYAKAMVGRTARRIMHGYVYVPESLWPNG